MVGRRELRGERPRSQLGARRRRARAARATSGPAPAAPERSQAPRPTRRAACRRSRPSRIRRPRGPPCWPGERSSRTPCRSSLHPPGIPGAIGWRSARRAPWGSSSTCSTWRTERATPWRTSAAAARASARRRFSQTAAWRWCATASGSSSTAGRSSASPTRLCCSPAPPRRSRRSARAATCSSSASDRTGRRLPRSPRSRPTGRSSFPHVFGRSPIRLSSAWRRTAARCGTSTQRAASAAILEIPGGRRSEIYRASWLAWSPDGDYLATVVREGIEIISLRTGRLLATLDVPANIVSWTERPEVG